VLYEVRVPAHELRLLERLGGAELLSICDRSWEVELESEGFRLVVLPDEVATPDEEHPDADVVRFKVIESERSAPEAQGRVLCRDLGRVVSIGVLFSVCSFGPVTSEVAGELLGFPLPGGRAYGAIFHTATQLQAVARELGESRAVVGIDLGLDLVTERCPRLVLYTSGFFVRASVGQLPAEEGWGQPQGFACRLIYRAAAC
jgi:hypothetical protein